MKKKLFIFLISIVVSCTLNAQWWGINKQYSEYSEGHSLSVSPIDNSVCVSGIFGWPYGSPPPYSKGGFLMKYDMAGSLEWEKIYYSYSPIRTVNATDSKGNIFVTGFSGEMEFENGSYDPSGMFLFKYDPNGNLLFTYSEPRAKPYAISIDQSDNILIAGYFSTHLDTVFYDQVFKKTTFLAKYDNDGNFLWVKYFFSQATSNFGYAFDMCLDTQGNIYSTGEFSFQGSYITDTMQLSNTGSADAFIAKYNSNAELQWVKTIKGDNMEAGRRIRVSSNGDIYVGGTFYSYANSNLHIFDSITVVGDTLSSEDIFLAKYNSSGNCQWVRTGGAKGIDYLKGLFVDNSGDAFITGYVTSGDSATFSNQTFYHQQNNHTVYLAQYDSNGNLKWLKSSQGGQGHAYNISGNGQGLLYITGGILGNWSFSSVSLAGNDEMFLLKLNSPKSISPAPKPHFPKIKEEEGQLIISNPSGTYPTIKFSSLPKKSELLITVKNSLGQAVYSERKKDFYGEYINTINLSGRSSGIYFVEVVYGEERITKKIVME